MLEFQCPHCHEVLNIPEQFVGSTGTCRKCRKAITITAERTQHSEATADAYPGGSPPTLVVFHCETTGTSTRRNKIIELAGIKIDLHGNKKDSFWSLANPEEPISDKTIDHTGITDDMVAPAQFPGEVVRRWFEWIGPHAILFTNHATFHARFVCAAMYMQNTVPPSARIIDVVHWAGDLRIPVSEYKLRTLVDYFHCPPIPRQHRALQTCKSIAALVPNLVREAMGGAVADDGDSIFGKILGKSSGVPPRSTYGKLLEISSCLDDSCGELHAREQYQLQMGATHRQHESRETGTPQGNGPLLHAPEWYEQKKRAIENVERFTPPEDETAVPSQAGDAEWRDALMAATTCESIREQNEHLLRAVTLNARDPWPYEHLAKLYIKQKDYRSARDVCERYFRTDAWKEPRWAESSLKLLDKFEKLDRKLALASAES